MFVLALLLAPAALAAPLVVHVEQPHVMLACGGESVIYEAPAGTATIDPSPDGACAASLILPAGTVSAGAWTCAPGACERTGDAEGVQIMAPAGVPRLHFGCPDQPAVLYDVAEQLVTLTDAPAAPCAVALIQPVGEVAGPGVFRCTSEGCVDAGAPPVLEVALAEGTRATQLELQCDDGFRQLQDVAEGKATFADVPKGECTLLFKGGAPAKFRPVRRGSWQCRIDGTVAVCSAADKK